MSQDWRFQRQREFGELSEGGPFLRLWSVMAGARQDLCWPSWEPDVTFRSFTLWMRPLNQFLLNQVLSLVFSSLATLFKARNKLEDFASSGEL